MRILVKELQPFSGWSDSCNGSHAMHSLSRPTSRPRQLFYGLVTLVATCWVMPAWADSDKSLRVALAERPDNVDLRLKLAIQLSHGGHRDEARVEARAVLDRAPKYWDAHVLLARIDAWDGKYTRAKRRVKRVLRAQPRHGDALSLAADLAKWAHQWKDAEDALRQLLAVTTPAKAKADVYARLASVFHAQRKYLKAYGLAGKALKLDSTNKVAQQLRDDITFVSAELSSQVEVFPRSGQSNDIAHAQTLTLSLFPRGPVTYSLSYEYRWRFETNNHRFGLRTDWRATPNLTVFGAARSGFVSVLPRVSAMAGLNYTIKPGYRAGARYSYDKMPWPGNLHRVEGQLGVDLTKSVAVEAAYRVGLLRSCGKRELVQGARAHGEWARGRLSLRLQYGFGIDAERVGTGAGADVCVPDRLMNEAPQRLIGQRVHDLGSQMTLRIGPKTSLRAGYGVQLRETGEIHLGHSSIRRLF